MASWPDRVGTPLTSRLAVATVAVPVNGHADSKDIERTTVAMHHNARRIGAMEGSVNCLPLSVNTSCGIPNRTSPSANANHTARPVARGTTLAITQNREWSSTPVTTFACDPSAVQAAEAVGLVQGGVVPQQGLTG
jgi:hypothetical protein